MITRSEDNYVDRKYLENLIFSTCLAFLKAHRFFMFHFHPLLLRCSNFNSISFRMSVDDRLLSNQQQITLIIEQWELRTWREATTNERNPSKSYSECLMIEFSFQMKHKSHGSERFFPLFVRRSYIIFLLRQHQPTWKPEPSVDEKQVVC